MNALLTNSPFEFFADSVGCVLIVLFSFGVADDIAAIASRRRTCRHHPGP